VKAPPTTLGGPFLSLNLPLPVHRRYPSPCPDLLSRPPHNIFPSKVKHVSSIWPEGQPHTRYRFDSPEYPFRKRDFFPFLWHRHHWKPLVNTVCREPPFEAPPVILWHNYFFFYIIPFLFGLIPPPHATFKFRRLPIKLPDPFLPCFTSPCPKKSPPKRLLPECPY